MGLFTGYIKLTILLFFFFCLKYMTAACMLNDKNCAAGRLVYSVNNMSSTALDNIYPTFKLGLSEPQLQVEWSVT